MDLNEAKEILNDAGFLVERAPEKTTLKLEQLILKLTELHKSLGNVSVRLNVPISSMQSEELPIIAVHDEGGYVGIYGGN